MRIYEEEFEIPAKAGHEDLLPYLEQKVRERFGGKLQPVRFVISATDSKRYKCEVGVIEGLIEARLQHTCSIFDFQHRTHVDESSFNAVLIIPTGIGSTIGGHAGDANPVATLLASVCNTLITHPNVVNASDINELPDNGLYVEGSIISRLMMGTLGLQPVRDNRVLVVMDQHPDKMIADNAINSVSAARASYGMTIPHVIKLDPSVKLQSKYSSSGSCVGEVTDLMGLLEVMDTYRGEYDAMAITTRIAMPFNYHTDYYMQRGAMVNPWGGTEAIFTHALSSLYDVPTAHAPMDDSREIQNLDVGQVDPRMAAEVISAAYFLCVLKGLQRSPRIIKDISRDLPPEAITARNISCLVTPDHCIGLPLLAALKQGIPVIAVRENKNIMQNDLTALPWAPGQLHIVDNYWEAAGIMAALRKGIDPNAVRRPISDTEVENWQWRDN